MTYRIAGLDPEPLQHLFALDDAALAERNARRVTAAADRCFPCRVSLEDARAGESLILLHHTSHDVATPYRSAYAIYIRENASRAEFVDETPPVFARRPLGLRGFDNEGNLREAKLALYSRRGVDEYRIVDWRRHTIDVFRRADGELAQIVTLGDGETITSPLLPGFEIPVVTLWEPES